MATVESEIMGGAEVSEVEAGGSGGVSADFTAVLTILMETWGTWLSSVGAPEISSKTSSPEVTFPKTVYSPSRGATSRSTT